MEGSGIQAIFKSFAGGAAEMDGRQFAKLSKDCNILDKKLTNTDIDLIFAKVKDKTARKINYTQFTNALEHCATKKGISKADLISAIETAGGPKFSGTKAEAVRFHDDKSLYTGVHANGGPSTVDAGNGIISDISQICDRTGADVRGIKK